MSHFAPCGLAGLVLAAAVAAEKPAITLYVAPDGNDGWSGSLPVPNADGTDGPLATLARARDRVRELKAAGPLPGPAQVLLRGGVYRLSQTVTFTPQDSGTPENPITYAAYPGEQPILSGGCVIDGFQPAGGVQSVPLPEVRAGTWSFRSLFAGGRRQIRARHPNFDPADPYRGGFLYVAAGPRPFRRSVGNIHNVGDSMTYEVEVPADGDYTVWVYYAAQNAPWGRTDMGGQTALTVDGGEPVELQNLPDTGDWNIFRWSRSATLPLSAGKRTIRWENQRGGGLNLAGFLLTDDPNFQPPEEGAPVAARDQHLILIPAAEFVASQGPQLNVSELTEAPLGRNRFRFAPGEFRASWAEAPEAEVHIFQGGDCRAYKEIVTIEAVDEAQGVVTVGGPEAVSNLLTGDRYFVENVPELLDAPGEWYLDRREGVLSYWPLPDWDPQVPVVAPVLRRVVELRGEPERPVTDLRFVGLTVQETDYSPEDGCGGYGMGNNGVFYLENARRCAVQDCRFENIGAYAVCLEGGGAHRVEGNDIAYGAEGGVLLLSTAGNTVSNNYIHHCGAVYKHIGGVVLQGAGTDDNVVSHNLIHHLSRYGVTLKNAGSRNVIEYNEVRWTNLETYDTGGIEVTQHDLEFRSHSVIRYNLVADTVGYSSAFTEPLYLSWGIYLDSFAGGYEVYGNIVFRNHHGGIMLQGGKDNRVYNNIFVDGQTCQGFISNFAGNSTGQVMERNIFAWSNPEALLFASPALDQSVIRVDHNLYFPPGGREPLTGWARIPFRQWVEAGFDRNSVIADPLFVDPEHDNYSLRPESPAFALGFQAIDAGQIGLQRGER